MWVDKKNENEVVSNTVTSRWSCDFPARVFLKRKCKLNGDCRAFKFLLRRVEGASKSITKPKEKTSQQHLALFVKYKLSMSDNAQLKLYWDTWFFELGIIHIFFCMFNVCSFQQPRRSAASHNPLFMAKLSISPYKKMKRECLKIGVNAVMSFRHPQHNKVFNINTNPRPSWFLAMVLLTLMVFLSRVRFPGTAIPAPFPKAWQSGENITRRTNTQIKHPKILVAIFS